MAFMQLGNGSSDMTLLHIQALLLTGYGQNGDGSKRRQVKMATGQNGNKPNGYWSK